jgi:hypothetical protein
LGLLVILKIVGIKGLRELRSGGTMDNQVAQNTAIRKSLPLYLRH